MYREAETRLILGNKVVRKTGNENTLYQTKVGHTTRMKMQRTFAHSLSL